MRTQFKIIDTLEEIKKIKSKINNMLDVGSEYDGSCSCNYVKKDFLMKNNYIAYPLHNVNSLLEGLYLFKKLKIDIFYLSGISKELIPGNKDKYPKMFKEDTFYTHFIDGYVYLINRKDFCIDRIMFWNPTSYFLFSSLDFKLNIIYSVEEYNGVIFFENKLIENNFLSILKRELDLYIDKLTFYNLSADKNHIFFFTKLKNYYESILKEQGYLK